ncbi:MAG: peptidylprolyl isomerase [Candidatus Faecousia sp.]|nr:peptidylprolyl isomerase [Candidatus Faecousia sp.]
MSASKKKKLRTDGGEKLTERQLAEQKEAKKIKIYSIAFGVVLAVMVVVAAVVGVNRSIQASGVHEKNTVAVSVGEHPLSNAELSYYYIDYINNYANTYGSYLSLFGIDSSVALNEQVYNEETGETWADYFISQAASSAQSAYALTDAAAAEGFSLPQEQQEQIDIMANNLDSYATLYGYSDTNSFLKAQYGNGASKASYMDYYQRNLLASAYQESHQESLSYTPEQIQEADDADPVKYSSYSYAQYYIPVSSFLTGGTTDEEGNTTYTAAEREAAIAAAKIAIAPLTDSAITTVEALDEAIAAMEINAGSESAASTVYTDQASSSINSNLSGWITDASRQPGDVTCIEIPGTVKDENGEDLETINAFYVVLFNGKNGNETELVNVRHILIGFEGEAQEDGTYSDEVKEAARTSAEEVLNEWKSGDATEESFAALAEAKSTDTGSNTNGGLYENVYPGQMVAAFNDWCFDADRKSGDTGIVETNYGYHVMYFVGSAGQTYREYQIVNDLTNADMESWYQGLLDNCTITTGDTSYMRKDIVLSK